jgi:ABC-type uncharacterized transport system involved in gliding motility auxiliary subunit
VEAIQAEAEAKYRQTEQKLRAHLEDVEKQLRGLRTGGGEGEGAATEAVITPQQRLAIDAARKDIVTTREQLRHVQLELNRQISALQTWLMIANIVLVPAVLAILAIVLALIQRHRRANARSAA